MTSTTIRCKMDTWERLMLIKIKSKKKYKSIDGLLNMLIDNFEKK
jgi:hypothetical protein|tara:strand:- start:453 stop:587 length:135 start_codon:yes stop_codon:yes gene_type:complete